jgi:fructose-1,6-bisphosphatase/inositol monophosphatase family enzyme
LIAKRPVLERVHRIYNFAGNPMMVKVADGSMSAVFELLGQSPHDVVPGAFIAKCAGAKLTDLRGRDIDLDAALCKPAAPDAKLRYVLSCTSELGAELVGALS